MFDVFRQLRSAVLFFQEYLQKRKRVCPIKSASSRIKKPGTLPKKFLERQGLLRIGDCFNQWPTITAGRKSERTVNQPVGWLNQHCAGSNVRLFTINHFEQNRAEQFPFDQRNIDVLGNGEVELQLDAETGLTESQISGWNFWNIRLLRLQVDHYRRLPVVALPQ